MNEQPTSPDKRAVVAVVSDGDNLLVIKRSQAVIAPGKICFPGGRIEPGEPVEHALVREMQEELNVEIETGGSLWQSVTPWGYEVHWLTARLVGGELQANPDEVQWWRWMDRDAIEKHPDLLESNQAFFAALAAGEFELPRD